MAKQDPLADWFFIDAADKRHRAERSRSFIGAKAASSRKRSFSPEECERLGVKFPTEWTAEGAAKAAEETSAEATQGLDDVDLAPESAPAEEIPEGPAEESAAEPPRPTPDEPAPKAAAAPAAPTGPVEERAPEPEPAPEQATADPAAQLAALPPDVLVNLLNTVAGKAWGRLVVWAGTPGGMKPIPLSPDEQRAIDDAMRAVLARYLPALPTNHPELWALAMATAMPVVVRRLVLEHEPLPDDDFGDEDDEPEVSEDTARRIVDRRAPAPPPPPPAARRSVFVPSPGV